MSSITHVILVLQQIKQLKSCELYLVVRRSVFLLEWLQMSAQDRKRKVSSYGQNRIRCERYLGSHQNSNFSGILEKKVKPKVRRTFMAARLRG